MNSLWPLIVIYWVKMELISRLLTSLVAMASVHPQYRMLSLTLLFPRVWGHSINQNNKGLLLPSLCLLNIEEKSVTAVYSFLIYFIYSWKQFFFKNRGILVGTTVVQVKNGVRSESFTICQFYNTSV